MFDEHFEVFLADTVEGKKEHYKLRYQVYCEEMGYEEKNIFADQQEKDFWDRKAVHFLIRHKETKQWVGAMRMVFKQGNKLPFQEFCSLPSSEDKNITEIEISRLCLVKEIRKRKTDQEPPLGLNIKSDSKQQTPQNSESSENIKDFYSRRNVSRSLIWGLFRAASIYSAKHHIDNWYFLGTKALARIISKEGFAMTQVGGACNHRGQRFPFKVEMDEILNNSIWSSDFKNGYRLYSELDVEYLPDVISA